MPSDHFPPPPGYPAPPAVASAEAAGPSYRAQATHYQGAHDPRSGLDRGTKRLVVVACGLGAALAAVAGGWAMMGGGDRPVPVFEADGRPLRVKPENPGGMQMAGLDEADGKAAMAPKTEAPSPQALRAQLPSNRPADPAPPAPPTVSPAAPPVAAVQPPPPTTPRRDAGEGETGPARADGAVPQTAAPPPAAPRTAAPAAAPAAAQAPAASSSAPASAALVQLAAVASERAAQAEWQRLSKRMPDLLGGRKPTVQRVDRDGRTIWRVRTGGFADLAEATSFCARVRAKGASCSIAAF